MTEKSVLQLSFIISYNFFCPFFIHSAHRNIILFFSTWVSEMLEMKIIGLTELLFRRDAELARSAIPLDVFLSLWVE